MYVNTNRLSNIPVTKAIYPNPILIDSADCQFTHSVHEFLNFRYQQEMANAVTTSYSL